MHEIDFWGREMEQPIGSVMGSDAVCRRGTTPVTAVSELWQDLFVGNR